VSSGQHWFFSVGLFSLKSKTAQQWFFMLFFARNSAEFLAGYTLLANEGITNFRVLASHGILNGTN
jgi:hypothetical protein